MGSIPLVALNAKTPEQPDLLQKYGQLAQLRNIQQQGQIQAQQAQLQQQEAPLRMQQLQQGVQQGDLQLQQQQQVAKDQQAVTAAWQKFDGKDPHALPKLVIENGGSGQAALAITKQINEQQQQAATTFKAQADGGKAMLETVKQTGDLVNSALAPLLDPNQVSDAQLPQALAQTIQQLQQRGINDPSLQQKAAELAQSGDPNAIRQGIGQFSKTLLAHTVIAQDAHNQAMEANQKAERDQAAANQKEQARHNQTEEGLRKQEVGIQGSRLTMEKQNANVLAGLSPDAIDLAADNYRKSGQMPPGLYRSPGAVATIVSRAAEMDKAAGGEGIATNKAMLHANTTSLNKLQTNFDQVEAFTNTASRNIDLLKQTAAKIPDLGARFANVPVRMISSSMIGTDNMAAFKTVLNAAQTESAKVLNSANASGVLSDSARHELQGVIDGNLPFSALMKTLDMTQQEFNNRRQSYKMQLDDLHSRIKGAGSNGNVTPQGDAPPAGAKVRDYTQLGGGK